MKLPIFPPVASSFSSEIDLITVCLLVLSGGIASVVFGLIFVFSLRYRKGSGHSRVILARKQSILEWSWTFVTFGVFCALFCWAAVVYFQMHSPPANAEEISVIGRQWMWKFQHSDGREELNELHVPLGKAILLTMTSQDVIHSLFVPAFRIKQDVLPGRYEWAWFTAIQAGTYPIFCTQYCGTEHASMRGNVVVLSPEDYERWRETGISGISTQGAGTRVSRGKALFQKLGCVHCHEPPSIVRCPDLHGIFEQPVLLTDGTTVVADENYIRESIVNPGAKIVAGYDNVMPPFGKQASDEDLFDLIAYVKSLSSGTSERRKK